MMFSKCYSCAKVRVFGLAIIVVSFGLSGWVASTSIVLAQDVEVINPVMLVPQGIGDNLLVDKGNQCRKDKHPGCLLFQRGELGHIVFHLPGSKNRVKYCSNANNVITKIEVTATGADEGTSVNKGDFNGPFPLPPWLQENAFPTLDLDTGIVYKAPSLDVARTQEWVTNLNNHANPENEEDVTNRFWYRVTVTACAENEEGTHTIWVSDPRGDNEGSK